MATNTVKPKPVSGESLMDVLFAPIAVPVVDPQMAKLERMIARLEKATLKFASDNGYITDMIKEPASREQMLADMCKELGGCMEKRFRAYTELLLEIKLPPSTKKVSSSDEVQYVKYGMIVLLDNPNSHNYPLHTPLMPNASGDGGSIRCYYGKGMTGNCPPAEKDSVRPATKEEIREFAKDFIQAQMNTHLMILTKEN